MSNDNIIRLPTKPTNDDTDSLYSVIAFGDGYCIPSIATVQAMVDGMAILQDEIDSLRKQVNRLQAQIKNMKRGKP
jgi:cell division protein FtsB